MQAVKEDGGDRGWVPVRLRFPYLWSPANHSCHLLVMVHWQSAYPWYNPADAEYELCPRTQQWTLCLPRR
jgi:hypothetical protein